jgi:hypothetical protein
MFDSIGDKSVRDALTGLQTDLDELRSIQAPFADLADKLSILLDKINGGQVTITIELKGQPK